MTDSGKETGGTTAFAILEQALKIEARRFVEARANRNPPSNALPSMLSLLGFAKLGAAADLSDPDISRPVVAWLRNAIRRERSRARSGHAGYDLGRHIALHEMLGHVRRICPASVDIQGIAR